ncbi:hypothetical protein TanjilG_23061 [Lupinus angustifolius]|uniref:Uncharacterized protein n=1 Tax=Lupinus angustifolius TaxID=3871 RepID=A0A1J7FMZ6_LUPAN|nr:hypothetical protein TanjilG_23061 [Lupinus angustifolius]
MVERVVPLMEMALKSCIWGTSTREGDDLYMDGIRGRWRRLHGSDSERRNTSLFGRGLEKERSVLCDSGGKDERDMAVHWIRPHDYVASAGQWFSLSQSEALTGKGMAN